MSLNRFSTTVGKSEEGSNKRFKPNRDEREPQGVVQNQLVIPNDSIIFCLEKLPDDVDPLAEPASVQNVHAQEIVIVEDPLDITTKPRTNYKMISISNPIGSKLCSNTNQLQSVPQKSVLGNSKTPVKFIRKQGNPETVVPSGSKTTKPIIFIKTPEQMNKSTELVNPISVKNTSSNKPVLDETKINQSSSNLGKSQMNPSLKTVPVLPLQEVIGSDKIVETTQKEKRFTPIILKTILSKTGNVTGDKTSCESRNKDLEENCHNNLCVVNGCNEKAFQYFKVPVHVRLVEVWKYCLKNQKLEPNELVCENHFIEEDILTKPINDNIGVLKDHVVPSIPKVLVGCCIPNCENSNKNTPNMYSLPIWGNYIQWIHLMGEMDMKASRVHDLLKYRVCEIHFSREQLKNVFEMVPTLNLPKKEWYDEQLKNYLKRRQQGLRNENEMSSKNINPHSKIPNLFACAYDECSIKKQYPEVPFHKFPDDFNEAMEWLKACKRTDVLIKKPDVIKSFIENSIGVCFMHKSIIEIRIKKKMENNAVVRTVFNKDDESVIVDLTSVEEPSEKSSEDSSEPQETYVPTREYCAFKNCSTYIKDLVKKYRFPADQELLSCWTEAAGMSKTLTEDHLRSLFVCGKHFNKSQYTEAGTLMLSAVPAPYTDYVDPMSHDGNEHWLSKKKKTLVTATSTTPQATQPPQYLQRLQALKEYSKPRNIPTTIDLTCDAESIPIWIPSNSAPEKNIPMKCVVKHCTSKKPENRLYEFPNAAKLKEEARYQIWIKAINNSALLTKSLKNYYKIKGICEKHFEKKYINPDYSLTVNAVPTLNLVDTSDTESEKDTSIVWKEKVKVFEPNERWNIFQTKKIKGLAILEENSIDFLNIERTLEFGKDCQKFAPNRFPFKLYRRRKPQLQDLESVNSGHQVQVHTAIIVDDDDEAEKEAVKMISKVLTRNSKVIPPRPRRTTKQKINSQQLV